jgi:cysteine-rich repeat protein
MMFLINLTYMYKKLAKVLLPFLIVIGLFVVASQPVAAATQTLYVDGELIWVDYGTYVHGPIDSPYLTINEALADMDTDGGTIYVAEGVYTEDLNLQNLDNIIIRGGYNGGPGETSPFTTQDTDSQMTRIDGQVTGTNISGTLTGLSFGGQTGISSFIDIDLAGSGYSFTVDDCRFTLASVTDYFVGITAGSGSNGVISNNVFTLISSDKSVVETAGGNGTVVNNNHFQGTSSLNGSYGIITATDGAKVYNNLINDSGSSNRVAIRINNSAEVYNNTIAEGTASSGAIASSGVGHTVYNNLIPNVTTTGDILVFSPGATVSDNYTDAGCDPAFVGGSGADAFKLGASSTCFDLGRAVSIVTEDYFGTSRPSGGNYDPGFHEFYVAPACGNSFVESGEQCDDGNLANEDGCSSTCQFEIVLGVCGDGTVDSGEQCDDGNTANGDGCSATCDDEVVATICGNWGDINSTDSHFNIAVYLCEHGEIIQGDSFGNLRIDDPLTRAELLAMAFRAREYEGLGVVDVNAEACFPDVVDDWYAKYFCTAKDEGFVEGYEDGNAKPGNTVLLAEGLKMFLGALDKYYSIDSGDCWYCSMIWSAEPHNWLPFPFDSPTDIGPNELSRRYSMDMLYRILIN